MAIRTNAEDLVTLWGETVLGTRPAPVTKGQQLQIIGHDLGRVEPIGRSRVLRGGDPNVAQPPRGRWSVQGRKVSMPIERNMVGLLLYKFFNSYGVAGVADPYTHTHKMVAGAFHAAGPYFGIEAFGNSVGKGDVLDGCVVAGFEVEVNTQDVEAMITFEIYGLGKGTFDAVAREQANPTTYTDAFYNMADARIKVDGAQSNNIVSAKLSARRQVSVRAVPNGDAFAKHIILGRFEGMQFDITGLWDDTSEVRALATGRTTHSTELLFNHPTNAVNHNLTFTTSEVDCYLNNVPAVGDGNEREITIASVPFFKTNADQTQLKAVNKNPLATYVGLMQ